jgi:hypothetical protein
VSRMGAEMSIKAMKLALEALEKLDKVMKRSPDTNSAITALRQAIEQAEKQEPVAWIKKDRGAIEVSIMSVEYMTNKGFEPLYTTPLQRQPLTDEQINVLADKHLIVAQKYIGTGEYISSIDGEIEFARAIEQAHGIKGEAC